MGGSEGILRAGAGLGPRERRGLAGPGEGLHGNGKRGRRRAALHEVIHIYSHAGLGVKRISFLR